MMTEYIDGVVNVGRGGGRVGTLRGGRGGEITSLDGVDACTAWFVRAGGFKNLQKQATNDQFSVEDTIHYGYACFYET